MNTLQIIQLITKVGKIVSKIIFICCIVGFCLCVVGIVGLALGTPVLKLGGITLESILQNEADTTPGSLYAMMATCAIVCAGEAVLAKFAMHYFEREQADETPFTTDGARELMRLGILSIAVPIAIQIVVQIVQAVLAKALPDVDAQKPEMSGPVSFGVALIVMALLCRYGAEREAEKTAPESGSDEIPEE